MTDTKGRKFETSIEIAAPPEEVWKALTEADEIARWFAPDARVTPGAGGSVWLSWGGHWVWDNEIAIWDPPRRLKLVDRKGRPYDVQGNPLSSAPVEIAVDYVLEGRGGKTLLRLVHSGFGTGASWDDELEGVSNGWPAELRNLRHYLERHRGAPRRYVWVREVTAASVGDTWTRLLEGLAPDHALDKATEGNRYSAALTTGDRFQGEVILAIPPGRSAAFAGTVDSWNEAIFRLWVDHSGEESSANVWLSAWGVEPSQIEGFRNRIMPVMRELFGKQEDRARA